MTTLAVMITTKNRIDELKRTLAKVHQLSPSPDQVLVTVDGSDDGSDSFVRSAFPGVQLTVHAVSIGSVESRAKMMIQTDCDLVLALDDDSYPQHNDCLSRLAELFAANDRLAIATFPQRSDEYPESLTRSDFGPERPIRSFPNSGACLRVSTYRQLAGFEPMFFHMYEEPDYALQCVANGYEVRFFPEITIRHHWTPNQRSEIRNHHRHARNEFWSTLMRCPSPQAFGVLAYRVASQARFASRRGLGWLIREPVWWFAALRGIPQALRRRNPVSWQGYKQWLDLPDN